MTSNVHTSDEFEYNSMQNMNEVNNQTNSNTKRPQVQLSGELGTSLQKASCKVGTPKNKPLPSEIFKAVEERFEKNVTLATKHNLAHVNKLEISQ